MPSRFLFGAALLAASALYTASAAPALLGLWRFDEADGDTAKDSSGLGHDGTLSGEQGNVPARVPSQAGFGQALQFINNGLDHSFVDIPASPTLKFGMTANDTWTIAAWTYEASDGAGGFVANYGRLFAQNQGYGLNFNSGSSLWSDPQYWIWHHSLGAWQQGFGTTAAVVPMLDRWIHLALVYDGQKLTLYRNGNQGAPGAKTSLSVHAGLDWSGYGSGIQIGTMLNMHGDHNWNGMIDDFALFNGALTEAQLRTIMASDFSEFLGGPPKLATEPEDQVANLGWDVTFSVSATSVLPMSYQWRFNGVSLAGATNASLVLTNVQVAQAGAYAVVVSNALGAVTSRTAVLSVSAPLRPCLVGLWRFEEGSGDQAGDSSGLGNNGTLVGENGNVPTWVAGQPGFGQALQFQYNGIDHCYVDVPGSVPLKIGQTPNAAWSLAIWAYEQSDGAGGYVSTYGRFMCQDGGFGIQWDSGATDDSQVYLWHGTLDAWRKNFGIGSPVAPLFDQWTHWALVYDGQNLTLYRNGNQGPLGGKVSLPLRASLVFDGYTGAIQIGSQLNMVGREWNGMLDDAAVFSGALTEAQVRAVMAGDFAAFLNPHPQLSIAASGGRAVLTWSWGVLQSAAGVTGAWQDEAAALSPLALAPAEARRFYRVRE